MANLPYTLTMYNPVKRSMSRIADITRRAASWRRSIRRVGGYWMGSFEYQGNRDELDDLFVDGLMRRVVETSGNIVNWVGFIGDMEYTRDGVAWRKSMDEVTNNVRILYTRLFDNMLTNGSVESGAWQAYNGATVTQSTVWKADGAYSCKIVCSGPSVKGAFIQTVIPIVEAVTYTFSVKLHIISGAWRVDARRADNNRSIANFTTTGEAGDVIAAFTIPGSNAYTGNVYILLVNLSGLPGTCYADGAILQVSPQPADTGWIADAASVSEYGRKDEILLEGGISSETAQAKATTQIVRYAWPRLIPPESFTDADAGSDRLLVTCYGYIFTLNWRMNETYGTFPMSTVVSNLLAGNDYVAAGVIDANVTSYTIESRVQLPIWQILKTITTSGDAAGNLWQLGCYQNRLINYTQFPDAIAYRFRHGKLYNVMGGLFEPWLAQPGWMSLDDALPLPGSISGSTNDDPRRALVEEVEYIAPNELQLHARTSD